MLALIEDYEQTRFQLQRRIYELNKLLRDDNLRTMEREKLIARRDLLTRERSELLEDILEMRRHLSKEEANHAKPYTGRYQRFRAAAGSDRTARHQPQTAGIIQKGSDSGYPERPAAASA